MTGFLFAGEKQLSEKSCTADTDDEGEDIDEYIGNDHGFHVVPGSQKSDGGGKKEKSHETDEKHGGFSDLRNVENFVMEKDEEKNNAVDTGRNGKRQEVVEHFPEKGNGDDDAELG